MEKTALVFGASGLIGSHLLNELLMPGRYDSIRVFGRTALVLNDNRVSNFLIDFDDPESYRSQIKGRDIFCCLGTTMRKAGSKDAFQKVDLSYPVNIARVGKQNGVTGFYVVSSLGANPASRNFYLRTKGEMEEQIRHLEFPNLAIMRPSLLLGERKEFRFGEKIAQKLYPVFYPFLIGSLRKYRGIEAADVARAMVILALTGSAKQVYQSDEIMGIANNEQAL
jgi:uncharacterized protein YbjT (DUF2867 family)